MIADSEEVKGIISDIKEYKLTKRCGNQPTNVLVDYTKYASSLTQRYGFKGTMQRLYLLT